MVKVQSIKGCDNTKMIVPITGGCKKLYCIFCKDLTTKFARHLKDKHSDEAEVGRFLTLQIGECVLCLHGENFVVLRERRKLSFRFLRQRDM